MKYLMLLATISMSAQTLTITGPATAAPGAIVTLNLSLAGSASANISGLQWTAAGAASQATAGAGGKTIYCSSNKATCLLIGASGSTPPVLTNTALADGVVATINVTSPSATGTMAFPLTAISAASTTGASVAVSPGPAYTLQVLSRCDLNADGKTDGTDVLAVLSPLLGVGACPLAGGCTIQTAVGVLLAASGGTCPL